MRIARERMLCIVTPGWRGGALTVADPRWAALQALCDDVGVIHFASVALLPPRPDEAPGTPPSLAVEWVVDEGLRPDDLLQRLAYHPSGALWDLYAACVPAPPAGIGARNEALLAVLRRGLSVADGAYVGPRDLSVGQVRVHRRLGQALCEQAQRIDPALRAVRSSFALALARWAFAQPAFEPVASVVPRSYWRLASGFAKLRMLFTGCVGAAVLLWLLREAARGVRAWASLTTPLPGPLQPLQMLEMVGRLVKQSAQALEWAASSLLHLGARLLAVLLLFALLYALLFMLLPALWRGWREALHVLDRTLDSAGDSAAARTCRWFGLLLLPPWLPLAAFLVGGRAAVLGAWQRWPVAIERVLLVYTLLLCAVLLVLLIGLSKQRAAGWLGQGVGRFRAAFQRTRHAPVPQAQQVHPAVEASEARLVGGTAHMLSLTELRTPRAWSAAWTRFFLRVVTWAGHVFFTEGRLGSLRGIQYGHWHVIDEGRRYLFFSNYDGNFGGYLDDFIQGAAGGTTLFWRWTQLRPRAAAQPGDPAVERTRRFPPTRLLTYRGVKCEQAFKTYARASMLAPPFRYDACGLTGQQKTDDRQLRDALFGERNDAHDDVLMKAIER